MWKLQPLWWTAAPEFHFAWQVWHFDPLGSVGHRWAPAGFARRSIWCFWSSFRVAGAALCCSWSYFGLLWHIHLTQLDSPNSSHTTFLTQLSLARFPLNLSHSADLNSSHPTYLTQLILHNSSDSIHLTQLSSHNSTHPTHLTPSPHSTRLTQFHSLNTTNSPHLTQVVSHNSSHTTQLTQLISHNSSHTTHLPALKSLNWSHSTHRSAPTQLTSRNSWSWGARSDSVQNARCCTLILIWSYRRTNFNPTSHLIQLISYTHHHTSLLTSRLTILHSWRTWFHMWSYPLL